MGTMNVEQIRKYLPHRYPFVLVDRVVEYEFGKSLTAIKNVTVNQPWVNGHFPHQPIMPGVLIAGRASELHRFLPCAGRGPYR